MKVVLVVDEVVDMEGAILLPMTVATVVEAVDPLLQSRAESHTVAPLHLMKGMDMALGLMPLAATEAGILSFLVLFL